MPIDIPLREISSGRSSHDPEIAEEGCPNDEADVVRLQGEPVIRTGRDISHFLVDLRDDGDPALTFRSLVIGTLFACVRALNSQVSATSQFVMSTSGATLAIARLLHTLPGLYIVD